MLKLKQIFTILLLITAVMPLTFCEKPPGPGGRATIKGRVWATDWDNQQLLVVSRGYSVDDRVYIIYGDDQTIGNDVRTGPDGYYEFKFLNKGKYKVYVNTLDTTKYNKGNDTWIPIIKEVEITNPTQTKVLETFYISK